MTKHKHLSLSERHTIQSMLKNAASFKAIARDLQRNCSTISKEVRSHLLFQKIGCFGKAFNDCINRKNCSLTHLCEKPNCTAKHCSNCAQCHLHCEYYRKQYCERLMRPPYVCNGCSLRNRCTLEKRLYSADDANKEYRHVLSESRSGICISEEEALQLDTLFSPLIRNGQSIHHICATQPSTVMFSEKTIYNYVNLGLFAAKNMDLPRKVRYKRRASRHDSFKVDKACRINRTYEDYLHFLAECPDSPIVQLDSVEGKKGGKVLLTIHFVKTEFMLAFLRDRNTAASVIAVFERFYEDLGFDVFTRLFPLLLTDNGSEFSNPAALEKDAENNFRTRVFYCDPHLHNKKGQLKTTMNSSEEFSPRELPLMI